MGVKLKPIIVKESIGLEEVGNKIITVDASNILHQFISTIRQPDGRLLKDSDGNITSHLVGLFYRTLKLMRDFSVKPVYVFDGAMPSFKIEEIEKRVKRRKEAEKKWEEAREKGKTKEAFREAVKSGTLTHQMIQDSKTLLNHMGLPFVQAPGEAEAQCAYMTRDEKVFAMKLRKLGELENSLAELTSKLNKGEIDQDAFNAGKQAIDRRMKLISGSLINGIASSLHFKARS